MCDKPRQHGHFINGIEESISDKHFISINPATGKEIATVSIGDSNDVDRAVKSAYNAYKNCWSKIEPAKKGRILMKIAARIREERDTLARMDSLDSGRPIYLTTNYDVEAAARLFEFYAGVPEIIRGDVVPVQSPLINFTLREPYGVVGAISSWNYPMINVATKVAPALACGNTIVIKTAEQSPLSALFIGRLAVEEGLPAGVLNIVNGSAETGAALVQHPLVSKIAFTGSTNVGKKIIADCQGIKSFTLELGGKTANIIFPDCAMDEAIEGTLYSAFNNQGQTCTAGTRLLVHENIAQEFINGLIKRAKLLRIGDPLNENTQVGPVVSEEQLNRIENYVRIGELEGAKLVLGGGQQKDASLSNGLFWQPTIFTDVHPDMRIAKEEIFGPILSIITFRTEEEAINIANNSDYGLATTLWTKDLGRSHYLAGKFESGVVWINTVHTLSPGSPIGGYKNSGIGIERGIEAINEYMKLKSVWVNHGQYQSPFNEFN